MPESELCGMLLFCSLDFVGRVLLLTSSNALDYIAATLASCVITQAQDAWLWAVMLVIGTMLYIASP